MNICITGALGHIGSAFIRQLKIPNLQKVYLVDNLLTQRYASLFDLPPVNSYKFIELDICSPKLAQVIKDSQVVVHLAAITDAETSFYKKRDVDQVNRLGLAHVAELCAKFHCSLIFPSTTSVYGVQKGVVDENCPETELRPQSPYAASKLWGEKLLLKLTRRKHLRCVVLRLGTIVGWSVGMRFHTAVNKFIWQAVNGQPLTVWKTALSQKRPYLDLTDCVSAFNHIITKNMFIGEIYNLVTANLTVVDILDLIKIYIPQVKLTLVDSPIMNQLSYTVNNQKSKESGFLYKGNLQKSIRGTIMKLKQANSHESIQEFLPVKP